MRLLPYLLILLLAIALILTLRAVREPCRHYLTDDGNGTPARLVIDCSPPSE